MFGSFFFCRTVLDAGGALPFCEGVVNFCLKPDNMVPGNVDPRSQMSTSLIMRAWKIKEYVSIRYRGRAGGFDIWIPQYDVLEKPYSKSYVRHLLADRSLLWYEVSR